MIQELWFPTSCGRVKFSADGESMIATGCYPPQSRLYELRDLSLKFSHHFVVRKPVASAATRHTTITATATDAPCPATAAPAPHPPHAARPLQRHSPAPLPPGASSSWGWSWH